MRFLDVLTGTHVGWFSAICHFVMESFLVRERILTTLRPPALRHPGARMVKFFLLGAAALAAMVAVGSVLWHLALPGSETVATTATAEPPAPPQVVELTPAKRQTADIHVTPIEVKELCDVRRVPGKIGYNAAKRVEVKLPVGGVVTRVLAQQGAKVRRGEQLAILASPDVGLARTDLVSAQADIDLARKESQWASEIADNLSALQQRLIGKPEMNVVEREFNGRLLGDHRDQVLSAYSKLLVAQSVARSTDEVVSSGAVSGLIAQERRSAREVAAAHFQSVLEQSLFDASQQRVRTNSALERAERLLAVAQQKLNLLLGPFVEIVPAEQDASLCELMLRAPIDGVVEERLVTDNTHFTATQSLFSLTNTDTLWVSAHIYDRQWGLLGDNQVEELTVDAPAVPGHSVKARVLFSAVTLSADSGAVPLVAEFENVDEHFKPGMFAWVSVPFGAPRRVLAVPFSAVTRHEQQAFVFVEEKPGTYRRVNVDLGPESGGFFEVRYGLEPGQKVVDRGVFTLKSELLLGEVES